MTHNKFMLCILMLFTAMSAFSLTQNVNGITWTYTVVNGTASVGDGSYSHAAISTSTSGAITIPSTLGGYKVTSIMANAFRNCRWLTSVTIPDSVASIGDSAFSSCSSLKNVTIPDSVTSIGYNAFWGCRGLVSITVGAGVTSIAINAFWYCSSCISFVVAADNSQYKSDSGLLVSKDGKTLVAVPGGLASVTIPDSVTRIGDHAFYSSESLYSVTIPNSVTSIGDSAFSLCGWLISITIPDRVTSIGSFAFSNCSCLRSITIPDSVTSIGYNAFSGCSTDLYDTTTIAGIKLVDGWAFESTYSIPPSISADLDLTGVRGIVDQTFYYCSGLKTVTIPQCVCTAKLSDIFPATYTDIAKVVIGDGVTSINANIFDGCTRLEAVSMTIALFMALPDGLLDSIGGAQLHLRSNGETGGDAEWTLNRETVHFGFVSWKSGTVSNDQESWFEMDVPNGGRLTFWWKASSESDGDCVFDYCYLSLDGEMKGALRTENDEYALEGVAIGGKTDWRYVEFDIEEAGPHKIRWTYKKDDVDEGDVGEDCIWLAEIKFLERSLLSFDLGGGEGAAPADIAELRGTVVALPTQTDFAWEDYVFNGWSDGKNTYAGGTDYTVPSSDVTLTAQWVAKRFLTFTLDGGEGEIPVTIKDVPNASVKLPSADGLSKAKHTFVGWSDGTKTYLPGENYQVTDSDVDFTAVWRRNEISVSISSADVADGGTIDTQGATITISAVATPAGGTPEIYYTLDGTAPTTNSLHYDGPFEANALSVTVKAFAVMENYFDSDVVEFSFTRLPYSPDECINVAGYVVSSGGNAVWSRVLDEETYDGVAALRSGEIGDSQSVWVEMTVNGAGELSFWGKIYSQNKVRTNKHDYLLVSVDGTETETLGGGEIGWTNMVVSIEGIGEHTVRWTYVKDDDGISSGEDCAWLDEVVWTPRGPAIEGDDKATIEGDSENGYTVKPSENNTEVVVTIPDGVDPGKVTVEVAATVETVKVNGANVKVMNKGHDIAGFLDLAAVTSAGGVINLAEAKVKDDVAKEALDMASGADIKISPTDPSITTANTRPGLKYTFVEGRTVEELAPTEQYKWGDNTPFKPTPSIKGGISGFYTIKVEK